jgi:mRNA-degrading endonuclease YafQ of YafQ-DinJ toxin-antitoxin module
VREIVRSVQLKRDVKLAEKRGKNMAKLRELILRLAEETRCRRATRTTL